MKKNKIKKKTKINGFSAVGRQIIIATGSFWMDIGTI